MQNLQRRAVRLPLLALLVLGCEVEPDPVEAVPVDGRVFDASTGDGAVPVEDAALPDVGAIPDAGSTPDAGPLADAGPLPDAGPDPDAAADAGEPPPPEVCDGIDQDGDGQIDEAIPAVACSVGQGLCTRDAMTACVDGVVVCPTQPGAPQVERPADQRDQDCDGVVDEAVVVDPGAPLASVVVGQSVCLHYLDGRARCYGAGPTLRDLPGRYLQLDADMGLCGVTLDGGMRCWLLRDGAPAIEVPGDFTQVAVGGAIACPIDRAGMHHCNTTWFGEPVPFRLPFEQPVARIAVHRQPWAILQDGDLISTGPRAAPVPGPFIDLSTRHEWVCGVRANGSVHCEGPAVRQPPADLPPAVAVRVTSDYTCVLTRAGDLRCWGTLFRVGLPEQLPGPFKQFDANAQALCAIHADGELVCFGRGERGAPQCAVNPLDCGDNGRCTLENGVVDQLSCRCETGFAGPACAQCAPGFGDPPECVVDCQPGERRCRGQHEIEVCADDGTRWDVEQTCCECRDDAPDFDCIAPQCAPNAPYCGHDGVIASSFQCDALGCGPINSQACGCGCDAATGQCNPMPNGPCP